MPPKRKAKIQPILENEYTIAEIVVTRGRSEEAHVRAFRFSPENISARPLGTLLGVFDVDGKTDETGYIVNFLSSVIRKEHFINPRRSTMESFEAALHKANIALAELAKHGTVAWLGHLHGVVALLEKNHFHFSVSGDASVVLIRGEYGTVLSEGLSSPEAATHPIKTFVEVSSGRLIPGDRLVILSPLASELLPPDILTRESHRMEGDRFRQYLHTALVNELSRAAAIVIEVGERLLEPPSEIPSSKRAKFPANVFSTAAFQKQTSSSGARDTTSSSPTAPPSRPQTEYTDEKTGHIYISGNTPQETSPSLSAPPLIKSLFQSLGSGYSIVSLRIRVSAKRLRRRFGFVLYLLRGVVFRQLSTLHRLLLRTLSSLTPHRQHTRAAEIDASSPMPPPSSFLRVSILSLLQFFSRTEIRRETFLFSITPARDTGEDEKSTWSSRTRSTASVLGTWMKKPWQALLDHSQRRWILGIFAAVGVLAFLSTFLSETPAPPSAAPTPAEEKEVSKSSLTYPSSSLSLPPLSVYYSGTAIEDAIPLKDGLLIVSKQHLTLTSSNETFPLPNQTGTPIRATFMEDLATLFVLTDTGTLSSFTPSNKKFASVLMPRIEGEQPLLGSYLTYIYLLNPATDTILRYPRATGGFSEPTSWLKEDIDLDGASSFSMSDTIVIARHGEVTEFSRGKKGSPFESSPVPCERLLLASHPDFPFLAGIEPDQGRLLVWNRETKKLLREYHGEELRSVHSVALDATRRELVLISPTQVSLLPLDL